MIELICQILDKRAFMLYPWENPKSEYYGKGYAPRFASPKSVESRRKSAKRKAEKIIELFNRPGDGK